MTTKTILGPRSPISDPRGYLTKPQVEQIISSTDSLRNKLLIMTLFQTGRRVSELVGYRKQVGKKGEGWKSSKDIVGGLKPNDILADRNAIVFNILKKKRTTPKIIGVPSNLKKALMEYIKLESIPDDNLVFPLSRQRIYCIVKNLGKKSGIKKVGGKPLHPHHFRHSYAVYMIDKIPLRKLQEQLAHSDINMTAQYLQYSTKEIEKDVEEAWK